MVEPGSSSPADGAHPAAQLRLPPAQEEVGVVAKVGGDALAGAAAGALSRLCLGPLDVLKIRLQLQREPLSDARAHYHGLRHALRTIVREEGIRALWGGSTAGIALWGLYSSLQFACYRALLRLAADDGSDGAADEQMGSMPLLLAGGGAAVLATAGSYPMDLFRTLMAAQGHPRRIDSYAALVRHQVRTHGLRRGLFMGMSPSLVTAVPYTALTFSLYGKFAQATAASQPTASPLTPLLCGAAAGAGGKLATYPLDVLKRRMQVNELPRDSRFGASLHFAGFADCIRRTTAEEGVRGWYKGMSAALLKAIPSAGLTFGIFHLLRPDQKE
eukprot:PLAT2598.2.p1 GENE.PLAT2598.2~~PLAT2598.2.p1  ORF type:complete len:330 (+),score=69.23 PLAT2598.2:27-1016(+)